MSSCLSLAAHHADYGAQGNGTAMSIACENMTQGISPLEHIGLHWMELWAPQYRRASLREHLRWHRSPPCTSNWQPRGCHTGTAHMGGRGGPTRGAEWHLNLTSPQPSSLEYPSCVQDTPSSCPWIPMHQTILCVLTSFPRELRWAPGRASAQIQAALCLFLRVLPECTSIRAKRLQK